MKPYVRLYLEYFNLEPHEVFCELCGRVAQDIHHIEGRLKEDHINNLMALCRRCHSDHHDRAVHTKSYLYDRHQEFMTLDR